MKGSFRAVRRKAVTLVFLAFLFVFLPCARMAPGGDGRGGGERAHRARGQARKGGKTARKEAESAVNTAKGRTRGRDDEKTAIGRADSRSSITEDRTALVTLIEG